MKVYNIEDLAGKTVHKVTFLYLSEKYITTFLKAEKYDLLENFVKLSDMVIENSGVIKNTEQEKTYEQFKNYKSFALPREAILQIAEVQIPELEAEQDDSQPDLFEDAGGT